VEGERPEKRVGGEKKENNFVLQSRCMDQLLYRGTDSKTGVGGNKGSRSGEGKGERIKRKKEGEEKLGQAADHAKFLRWISASENYHDERSKLNHGREHTEKIWEIQTAALFLFQQKLSLGNAKKGKPMI